jgi:hypothetical protein
MLQNKLDPLEFLTKSCQILNLSMMGDAIATFVTLIQHRRKKKFLKRVGLCNICVEIV